MIKGSSFGSRVRKRLSDITNIQSNPKSPFKDQLNQNDDSSTNNYVQHLLKENALMSKLIEEKDKIIEFNRVEMQKLRGNLQRTQLQNWHLAQSNSQMLAELNMSKDRLKALQHDLACKDALYKAKMHDAQVKEKMQAEENIKLEGKTKPEKEDVDQPKQANDNNENRVSKTKRGRVVRSQLLGATNYQQDVIKEIAENKRKEGKTKSEKADVDQPKQANDNNENRVSKTKRERVTRSQSLGATNSQQDVDKEIAENKRRCLRRQSVRLKPQESDADLYDEIDVNAPLTQSLEGPPSSSISDKKEPFPSTVSDKKEPSPSSISDREEPSRSSISDREASLSQSLKPTLPPQRASIGRPSRKAAEKVQSYKDIPLNAKMRRPC